jgi:ABC-type sugar transport system ATPase subunit
VTAPAGTATLETATPLRVELGRISKAFGATQALDAVSLDPR